MKKVPDDLAAKLYEVGDQFLAQGADGRIDRVAEEAGIPRATLYYYFSGKDDLVTYFMTEKMSRIATHVEKAKAGEGTALARFGAALEAVVGELASNPALCLNLMVATGRMDSMSDMLIAVDRAVMAPLRELLIEARAVGDVAVDDVDVAVAAVLGAVNTAVMQRWAATGEVDPARMAGLLPRQLIDGLRAR
jgi:AcrR family transcriptional regulator